MLAGADGTDCPFIVQRIGERDEDTVDVRVIDDIWPDEQLAKTTAVGWR